MTSTTPARPRTAMPATAPIRPPGAQPRPRRRPLTPVTRRALTPVATTGRRLPRDTQEPRAARRRLSFPVVLAALAAAAVALLLSSVAPASAASVMSLPDAAAAASGSGSGAAEALPHSFANPAGTLLPVRRCPQPGPRPHPAQFRSARDGAAPLVTCPSRKRARRAARFALPVTVDVRLRGVPGTLMDLQPSMATVRYRLNVTPGSPWVTGQAAQVNRDER